MRTSVPVLAPSTDASSATSGEHTPLRARRAPAKSRKARLLAGESAERAYEDLCHSLLLARERGQQVPCLGPDADNWVSDDYDRQVSAADACLDCPMSVFVQCQRYSDLAGPTGGTWAGVTSDPARKAQRPPGRRVPGMCGNGLHDITRPGALHSRANGKKGCVECRRARATADRQRRRASRGNCGDAYAYVSLGTGAENPRSNEINGSIRMKAKNTQPTEARTCLCGTCNEVVSAKSNYKSGHDARHVAVLVQGLVNDVADGRQVTAAMITAAAKDLPSEALRAKFRRAAERATTTKPAPKATTTEESAK